MKKSFVATAAVALLAFLPNAFATESDERASHYKGKPAATLPEAVRNFSEYNAKLEAILQGELSDAQMAEVHRLTYTLENALARINDELARLGGTLEKVHVASEKLDREAVSREGREYLSVSRQIVK